MHNTGEGGLSPYHRQGGDIVLQIGTAYFGCRDEHGNFSLGKLKEVVESAPVRAIEIKLSQGAKPGLGGLLPAAKVTREISEIRGIPMGQDCASPSRHTAFTDEDSLLDFVELSPPRPGCPSGSSRAVGEMGFWHELTRLMARGRPRRRLRHRRRRRGRHRRLAADLRRLDRAAVPDGLLPGLRHLRRGGPDRRRHLHRLGQARPAGQRRRRVRARRRHGQRRPRGDDVDRLHPVAEVPHRPLPDRRGDPEPLARRTVSTRSRRPSGARSTSAPSARSWSRSPRPSASPTPGLITAEDVDIFCGDYEARSLREVYGYKDGWGTLGPDLAERDHRLMAPARALQQRDRARSRQGEGEKPLSTEAPIAAAPDRPDSRTAPVLPASRGTVVVRRTSRPSGIGDAARCRAPSGSRK